MDDKLNKLYTDFVGRDALDGISAGNFDSLKNDAFITPENKEFFEDMLRTGWLTGQLSSSGPMPNTCKIVTAVGTASSAITDIYNPSAGEVWEVQGFAINRTGLSGTIVSRLIATDGAQTTTIDMSMIWLSSTQDPVSANEDGFHKFYIDQNITLKGTTYFGGGFPVGESVEYQVLLSRVR